jgi:hypothetical protein
VVGWIKRVAAATQPYDAEFVAVLARRWEELPPGVRTPGQTLGRHGVGCEGTHGVFPRCDFACAPCYHSRDANKVRIDGPHTLKQVETQMALLRERRGPRAHAQLIGGEVSLLSPDDHAEALLAMRRYGREPMSFTHGDLDYGYLERLAMDPATGQPRFRRLSFAAHFDTTMVGRKGITRTGDEASLDPHRQRFAEMFVRLRREHGVRAFLAHNMTVTPSNLPQLAGVIRRCRAMGYGMFSFQPAAFVGDPRRWNEAYRDITGFCSFRGEFTGIQPQLCQKFGVLIVVDLVGELLDCLLNPRALTFFTQFVQHPLLVELHRSLPSVRGTVGTRPV